MHSKNCLSSLRFISLLVSTAISVQAQTAQVVNTTTTMTNLPPGVAPVQLIRAPAFPTPVVPSLSNHLISVNGVLTNITTPPAQIRVSSLQKVIRPTANGAVADFGMHQVAFAGSANVPGVITLTLAGGKRLTSQALFLAYYDPASGQSYLLGQAQEAPGTITATNEVVYSNAFSNVRADLRYRYTANSLEQDVILRANLPTPESVGFSSQTVCLSVWSEFFNPVAPVISAQSINLRPQNSTAAPALANDQTLDFGTMRIVTGKSFSLADAQNELSKLGVAKAWETISNRTFLVEMIDYSAAKPKLDLLPAASVAQLKGRKFSKEELVQTIPQRARVPGKSKPLQLALSKSGNKQGFVLDYLIVTGYPVPPNLIGWWPAGGNAKDASVYHNDGTLNGTATFDFGKVGQTFSFNGTSDNVEVPDAPSLNPPTAITIEAWVYITGGDGLDRTAVQLREED
jgi:hypothetical protein